MKLKDLLQLNKESVFPNAERVRSRVLKRRSKTIGAIVAAASACAAVALVAAVVLGVYLHKGIPEPVSPVITGAINVISSVEPSEKTALGIPVKSHLIIKTTEDLSGSELKARIAVTPETDYSIRKTAACNYELVFDGELKENTLYNVAAVYNDKVAYRWAFQTESAFQLVSVFPGKNLNGTVDTDTAIEFVFSHANVTGVEKAFTISPAVKGTFQHYGRCWAFVPGEKLKSNTLYTVTLSRDVGGPDGEKLPEDYTMSFLTSPGDSFASLISSDGEVASTYLVDEAPVAAFWFENIDVSSAHVDVFTIKNADAYIDAYRKYVSAGTVSSGIKSTDGAKAASFDAAPLTVDNYNDIYEKAAFINYPEPLPQGYYYAEITVGGQRLYQLLEVTDLSVYSISANGKYTVWVNRPATGEPVSGATVSLEGFKDQKTGTQGIAAFSGATEETDVRFMKIENGGYPYVLALNGEKTDEEVQVRNRYYSYITTDSALYHSGDTVGVFGMILPRLDGVRLPKEVTLESDLLEEPVSVPVENDGSFYTQISLGNTALTSVGVRLCLKDQFLNGTYFDVAEYRLPAYAIQISTDRNAYRSGDTVQITANVTYMDGTPAAGIEVEGDIAGITDANGVLRGTYLAEVNDSWGRPDNSEPELQSVGCHVANGDFSVEAYASFFVYAGDYAIDGSFDEGTLNVSVHERNMQTAEALNPDDLNLETAREEIFLGAPADIALHGTLYRVSYDKSVNGTTYDAINKKIVELYEYTPVEEIVREFDLLPQGGKASVQMEEPLQETDPEAYYYVTLQSGVDESVKTLMTWDYAYRSNQHFSIRQEAEKYRIGDPVTLRVFDNVTDNYVTGGSVLFTVADGDLYTNLMGTSPNMRFEFKQEYATGVNVYGAYFDGKHVYSLGYAPLEYETESSMLRVSMRTEKPSYEPGDEIKAFFTVTDATGQPVSATLYVSAIDRGLYLLSNNAVEPVYTLLSGTRYYSTVYTTFSYSDYGTKDFAGGEGGGGGDSFRSDFDATAYDGVIRTDGKGEATLTFTLPDSITDWKIIARGFTADAKAGLGVFDAFSTQEYFAQVRMSESVKAADDFSVGVKGEGRRIAEGTACSHTVTLKDRDGKEVKTLSVEKAKSQYAFLNFGPLSAGEYTVEIKSVCGNNRDNIRRALSVKDSEAAVWIHTQEPLNESSTQSFAPLKGNVTLTVVDEKQALWQSAISRLQNSYGERLDQVLGQYLAERFYETGRWMDTDSMNLNLLQNYTRHGGVRLFENSEYGSTVLEAKLAAAAPAFVERTAVISDLSYYVNNRYSARVETIAAYFGLAALGEPVLGDLQSIYENTGDFSAEEYAYLALGFAYAGDYDTAKAIYNANLKDLIVDNEIGCYAERNGAWDEDLTGSISILANRLSLEICDKLIRYISENDSDTTLLNLELITYLNDHIADVTGENAVSISTGDGRNETYRYPKNGALVLNLTAAQAANIRIVKSEGNSVISYSYYGSATDLQKKDAGNKLTDVSAPASIKNGETARIRIKTTLPETYKEASLNFTLPAGLYLEEGSITREGKWVSTFSAEYNSKAVSVPVYAGDLTVELIVRAALPGQYTVEPILITNGDKAGYLAADPLKITITE